MFRKLTWGVLVAVFACLTTMAAAQDAGNTAYLRVLQLANDGTILSLTLPDGRTPLANFAPGSVSDYMPFDTDRSTLVSVSITPAGGLTFTREWAVPPLTPGYHTAAVVGSGRDNTLELIFIDEDAVCAGKLEAGSCVILVNNIKGSPSLDADRQQHTGGRRRALPSGGRRSSERRDVSEPARGRSGGSAVGGVSAAAPLFRAERDLHLQPARDLPRRSPDRLRRRHDSPQPGRYDDLPARADRQPAVERRHDPVRHREYRRYPRTSRAGRAAFQPAPAADRVRAHRRRGAGDSSPNCTTA